MQVLADRLGVQNIAGRAPLEPGERAPDFALPALNREGTVSLADYRGKSGVFLAIERGLYCPFCRRHITTLGATARALGPVGVEVLAVVATPPERARAYLRYRPAPVPLAADPQTRIHRDYGLPKFPGSPELMEAIQSTPINPFGNLPDPRPLRILAEELGKEDPYEWTEADQDAWTAEQVQTTGQFLIDREGVVRWRHVEGEVLGPASFARYPSTAELVEVARDL